MGEKIWGINTVTGEEYNFESVGDAAAFFGHTASWLSKKCPKPRMRIKLDEVILVFIERTPQ